MKIRVRFCTQFESEIKSGGIGVRLESELVKRSQIV